MPDTTTYDSLFAVASTHPNFGGRKSTEADQDHLHRICECVAGVPDDSWNSLTEAAKQWYDNALDSDNRVKSVLDVPEGFLAHEPPAPSRRRPVVQAPVTVYDLALVEVRKAAPDFAIKHLRETDDAYLARMVKNLPETIPNSIMEWVAAADDAVQKHKTIPMPEGYPGLKVATPVVSEAVPEKPKTNGAAHATSEIEKYEADLAEGKTKRKRAPSAKKEPAAPKEAAPVGADGKHRRKRKPSPNSVTALMRTALTRDPSLTVDDLMAMIKAAGKEATATTIASTRAAHLASMQTIQSLGYWASPAE